MKLFFKKYLFVVFVAILSFEAIAQQPGDIDTTFNPTDIGYGNGDGAYGGGITTISRQIDGKIIIGGNFSSYSGITRNCIARLNANGSLDTTFKPGTGANNIIWIISLQSDDKMIIVGDFISYNGTLINRIARINTDGSLDTTFNPGTGASDMIVSAVIQNDGKIIIGGSFTSYNGTPINRIARVNIDGSLDMTFSPGNGVDDNGVTSISLQSDGKIIIGGRFTSYNGTSRNHIARLNSNGSLDNSFNPGTGTVGDIRNTSLQLDGKIIIGGTFSSYNGTSRKGIARLNIDGSLDTTFNPGTGTNYQIETTAIQSDGKILIGGAFTSYSGTLINCIVRLDANGSLDTTFNVGAGTNSAVYAFFIRSDGKIIIGGNFSSYNGIPKNDIARLNVDGSLDTAFTLATGANGIIYSASIQNNGRIVIGGSFSAYNGTPRYHVARLNSDGTIDTLFKNWWPGQEVLYTAYTIAVQNDGKVVFGGSTPTSRFPMPTVFRVNSDGSQDNNFYSPHLSYGSYGGACVLFPLSNGKIFSGFTNALISSTSPPGAKYFARLGSNGTADNTFNNWKANGGVAALAIQTDGKIVIGGSFTDYNGTPRNRIARLYSDGTLDTSFNPGTGAGNYSVSSLVIQAGGKIIIGGDFITYNGTTSNRIARINPDGSLDTSFKSGSGADNYINSLSLQSDGKIIIGGAFTSYNGVARNYIARLNADGSLDTTFNIGTGASGIVYTTVIQNDGKIIIGGDFTSYNGIGRNRIARLLGGGWATILINNIRPTCFGQCDGSATANPFFGKAPYTYLWSNGQTAQTASGLCAGTYSVMVTDSSGVIKFTNLSIVQPAALTANYVVKDASSCSANDGSIKAYPSGGTSPFTYLWSNGQTTQTISNLISNTFSVTIVDLHGCTYTDSVFVGCSSGITQYYNDPSIIISPNPSSGIFTIRSSKNISQIEVANILGEKIYSSHIKDSNAEIDLSKQPDGIYFVKIKTADGVMAKKIVISR